MPFLSYAQNGEDVLLWRALGDVASGFYVDVGAADPDEDSVTRAFYDRGWRGINIEPVPRMAARIAAARPRDVTLPVAAGAAEGAATLHVLDGTGLSTTDPAVLASLGEAGAGATPLRVPVRRLAAILDEHAPDRIEFLKIDVEGAERAVLEGCDFQRHRPRVVLLEATWPNSTRPSHEAWEGLLLAAHYRFAFFDGLNRFYVADEWAALLLPRLAAPANVLDNFARAGDPLARHVAAQEVQLGRIGARAAAAEEAARAAFARAFEQARDLGTLRHRLDEVTQERQRALARLHEAESRGQELETRALASEERGRAVLLRTEALERELAEADRLMRAVHRSTSWRVTGPLRAVSSLARGRRRGQDVPGFAMPPKLPDPVAALEPAPAPLPDPVVILRPGRAPGPLRAVHQFHSGSATGDAVTNSMLLIRAQLRRLGYRSEIFVQHRDPALAGELHLLEHLPAHPDHVLIVHHSMGYDGIGQVLAHPAPKVLYFHNITPAHLLPPGSLLPAYAELGRGQLGLLRPAVAAAVAASEYNAVELRRAGFDPVWVATLLFDPEALRARADPAPLPPNHPYTVLFVGRVIESKAQADLVEAFARFRSRLGRPARLVLAGRTDSPGQYLQAIDDRMRRHGLEAELVVTGPLSDAELRAQYRDADLYVSLSHHEGFGVPLAEAMAQGIPVLAWPGGAVPYTLAGAGLLASRQPDAVATAMLEVALDPGRRTGLLAAQGRALDRFALDRQWQPLQEALVAAGAAPLPNPELRRDLAAHLRFAVFGHTQGSYSLAAINRDLAAAIEAELPGRSRLIPVEPERISGQTPDLAFRAPPETGPEVVISQHYPVLVPETPGDLTLALVFWEETLLPAATIAGLDAGFDGVLAPSRFVAKALQDSGLTRPVHVIGQAPDLAPFEAIGRERAAAPRPARPFTFLHVSSCFPRKGVDVLLAAYAAAFRRGDEVRLVIKGFPNPHNQVPDQVAALRADPDLPAIEVVDADLEAAALHDLYRQADAMVLPARGEGFNLPAAEAMAAGLPLIVTGFGGHLDFCNEGNARLLRYRLAPSASHLASGHSLWAEPDPKDLAAALRDVEAARRDPVAGARLAERTGRARGEIAQAMGRRAMVRRLQAAALDGMLRPPAAPVLIAWVTSWDVRCGVAEYTRHLVSAMPPHPGVAGHLVLPDDRSAPCPEASPRSRPAWTLADAASLPRLEGALTAEDPRVVVIQHQPGLMPWPVLQAFLASPTLAGRVVVITLHNTRDLLDVARPERDRICAALGGLARVVVHSLADLHRLQDLGLAANVTLVPHGVRLARPIPAPRASGAAPLIGCYGFFLPGKGIPELIQALALLRQIRPQARLLLVNADYGAAASTEEIRRCEALAQALGLADAIEWETRFLPDERSLDLLQRCDLVVIPTQASREGSSAAVRTALAAGPPVLVTPLGLFDDVGAAVARAGGILPADLAAGIEGLLGDPEAARQVQAGAQDWLQAHRWPEIATLFQRILVGLAARPAPGWP